MDGDDDGNGICFPYDVLISILRRVPCRRALAESRLVCRSWRAIIDTHNLLAPHYFPQNVFPGIFTNNYGCNNESSFYAPPPRNGSKPAVFRRPVSWHDWACVVHHCNGLVLITGGEDYYFPGEVYYVCNPTTARRARLPRPSRAPWPGVVKGLFLAFDPLKSRHYQVFFFPVKQVQTRAEIQQMRFSEEQLHLPRLFEEQEEEEHHQAAESHIHPAREREAAKEDDKVIPLLVFSSQTGQWESRRFMPGRCAPEHLYDKVTSPYGNKLLRIWWSAEYFHGSLYVHCHDDVLMILHCSEETYDMLPLPAKSDHRERMDCYHMPKRSVLAGDKGGVRYVALDEFRLRVWTLTESSEGRLEWMPRHDADLGPYVGTIQRPWQIKLTVSWEAVERSKRRVRWFGERYFVEGEEEDGGEEEEVGSTEGSERSWDSDEDNFVDVDKSVAGSTFASGGIMGSHPHKDVLLLELAHHAVAYHLGTSRMQYLGQDLVREQHSHGHGIYRAFPYRPCYVDALPAR